MSEPCACNIEASDYGSCSDDFQSAPYPKARKSHKCEECGDTIGPGEVYERVFGVWDSCKATIKTCQACYQVRNALFTSWDYGNVWQALREHMEDEGCNVSNECLDKIGPDGRMKLAELMQKVHAEWLEIQE